MTTIGIEGMSAMIEAIIYYKPAVMRFLLPFANIYMAIWEEVVMLVHKVLHASTYSVCIDNSCNIWLSDIENAKCERCDITIYYYYSMVGCTN